MVCGSPSSIISIGTLVGHEPSALCYFDPWGCEYNVAFDYSYDGKLKVAYGGEDNPRVSVGAFSLGLDRSLGASGNGKLDKADDLASWK